MQVRFQLWYLYLVPLLVLPFIPAIIIFSLSSGCNDSKVGKESESNNDHSKLFNEFVHETKQMAEKLDVKFEVETEDSESHAHWTKLIKESPNRGYKFGPGPRDLKGVILEFETGDRRKMDELTLKVHDQLSKLTGDRGGQPRPTSERLDEGHIAFFDFNYDFPDGPSGAISCDVQIGASTSRLLIHIAEG